MRTVNLAAHRGVKTLTGHPRKPVAAPQFTKWESRTPRVAGRRRAGPPGVF